MKYLYQSHCGGFYLENSPDIERTCYSCPEYYNTDTYIGVVKNINDVWKYIKIFSYGHTEYIFRMKSFISHYDIKLGKKYRKEEFL
jgi:hypothetical protein